MGAGSAWGDREEFLHPRDSHGRFRNTWRMPQAAADAIAKFLDGFSPKTFASDQAAQSWVHNESRKNRLNTNSSSAISNFVKGFSNVNNNLRAGKADPQAAQMLKGAEPLPTDLILTKTVDGSAFGLGPDNIANVEELTGKLIHDPGFTSANIGTPNPPTGPGPHIQMTIATPAGTKAIIPQVTSPTSEVMLTPDQNLRVTKVTPDGKGGFYMMAVATPGEVPNEKSTPLHEAPPAPAPLNLPPKPGEAPVAPATPSSAPESAPTAAPPAAPSAPLAPTTTPPAPPGVVSPRTEPNVVEALTPGGTPTPAAPAVTVPSAEPLQGAPQPPVVNIRQALKESGIPSPSAGRRREAFNRAYLGLARSKDPRHPDDVVRDLESDIHHAKDLLEGDVRSGTDSGPLPGDIESLQRLRDLIVEKYQLGEPKSPEVKAPEVKAPEAPKRRGPKTITKEEMSNKAEIRRESRARTPAPTAAETKRAEEVKALGIKSGEEAAAKTAADTAAAQKTSEPWLEKAGIRGADLTDHERLGVMLMATQINNKKISRPEAARRLRGDGKNERLARIADAITARPSKAAPVAAKAAPAPPAAEGAIPEKATIAQLRQIAKDRGVKIPSKLTRKDDIRAHLEGGGAPSAPAKPSVEDRLATHLLNKLPENVRKDVLENMSPADRRIVDEAVQRVQGSEAELKKAGAGGAIPEKATIADLRKIAGDRNIKIPSKITRKDDIRAFIEGGGKPSGPSGAELARIRQGHIDEARKTASLLSGLDGALADGASTQALTKKLGTDANRLGIPDATRERLLKAVDSGDEKKIRAEIDKVAKEAGLTVHSGNAGSATTFNLAKHTGTGEGLKPGQKVNVVRPGHEATLPGGEKVQLSKATVESAAPETARSLVRVDLNGTIKDLNLDPKVVRDRKVILDDVRNDLQANKKSPAQIGRELSRVAEGIERSSVLRHGGHRGNESPERLAEIKAARDADAHDASELRRLADKLQTIRRTPGSAPVKAAAPVKKAVPTKAISKIEAPQELKQAVAKTSIADLRKQAEAEGIKIPASAKTKQQIVDHIAQTMAARELARRGVAKATAPKVAKAEPAKAVTTAKKLTPREISGATSSDLVKAVEAKQISKPEAIRTIETRAKFQLDTIAHRKIAVVGPPETNGSEEKQTRQIYADLLENRKLLDQLRGTKSDSEILGVFTSKPILKNHWGVPGGEINYHKDGAIGRAVEKLGVYQKMDIDGEPLANVVGKIATDGVRGDKTSRQVADALSKLADRLPEGNAKKLLSDAAKELDIPDRKIAVPDSTPFPLKELAVRLSKIPLAHRTEDQAGRPVRKTPVLDSLAEILKDYANGNVRGFDLIHKIEGLHNTHHESEEGKFELDRAIRDALTVLREIGPRNLNPPKKEG